MTHTDIDIDLIVGVALLAVILMRIVLSPK